MDSLELGALPDPYDDIDEGYGTNENDDREIVNSTVINAAEMAKQIKREADKNRQMLADAAEEAFASGEVGEPDEYPQPDDIFGDEDDDDDDGDEATASG